MTDKELKDLRESTDFSTMSQKDRELYMSSEAKEKRQLLADNPQLPQCPYDPTVDHFPFYGFKPVSYKPLFNQDELKLERERMRLSTVINLANRSNP